MLRNAVLRQIEIQADKDDDTNVKSLCCYYRRLKAIVDTMPHTADKVPVKDGMVLYNDRGGEASFRWATGVGNFGRYLGTHWYSTLEAAQAAWLALVRSVGGFATFSTGGLEL